MQKQELITSSWFAIQQQQESIDAKEMYILDFGSKDSGKKAIRMTSIGNNQNLSLTNDRDNTYLSSYVCAVKTTSQSSKFQKVKIIQIESQNKQYQRHFENTIQIIFVCKSDEDASIQYIFRTISKIKEHKDKIPKGLDFLIIRTYKETNTQKNQKWDRVYKDIQKNIKQFFPNHLINPLTMPNLLKQVSQLSQDQNCDHTQILFQKMIGFRFNGIDKLEKLGKFLKTLKKRVSQQHSILSQSFISESLQRFQDGNNAINESMIESQVSQPADNRQIINTMNGDQSADNINNETLDLISIKSDAIRSKIQEGGPIVVEGKCGGQCLWPFK